MLLITKISYLKICNNTLKRTNRAYIQGSVKGVVGPAKAEKMQLLYKNSLKRLILSVQLNGKLPRSGKNNIQDQNKLVKMMRIPLMKIRM